MVVGATIGFRDHGVSGSSVRLLNAGLIGADVEADRYRRTPVGDERFTRRLMRRGLFGWIDAIPPALRRLGPPQDGDWPLPPGKFDEAVQEYLAPGQASRAPRTE